MRVTDDAVDMEIELCNSLNTRQLELYKKICADFHKTTEELDTLRKHRNYASEFLDAREKLGVAVTYLKQIAQDKTFVGRNDPLGMPIQTNAARTARAALQKIGEVK